VSHVAPSRGEILAAVEAVLDAGLYEVTVTQDGQPSTLDAVVRALDNNGLIDWDAIRPPRDRRRK
jgi:hypothetical protein